MSDDSTKSISEILASGIAGRPDESEQWQWNIARWENYYRYACESYARVQERWSAADEKAWKYLSTLGIIIGAGALTSGQIAHIFARPSTYLDGLFICAYLAAAVFVLTSFIFYLQALQLKPLKAPPTHDDMRKFFESTQHVDVLFNLSREMLNAANDDGSGPAWDLHAVHAEAIKTVQAEMRDDAQTLIELALDLFDILFDEYDQRWAARRDRAASVRDGRRGSRTSAGAVQ